MKISKINLVNFRNYSNITVTFSDKMNIFIGDNAQGKTNILESIVILALTKSHRVGNNPNIIQFNKSKCTIKGTVKNNNITSKLGVIVTPDSKKIMINQTDIKKVADYISNLNVIIFTPDDLDIIKSSPNIRRNLLNIQLSQISKVYLNTYNEYNKILKTRNEYLKILFSSSVADKNYLDIITDRLIEKAVIIYKKREEYLNLVNEKIDYYFREISNTSGLKIIYSPNVSFQKYDILEMKKTLKNVFEKNYYKELNYGMTLFGPHRDDFIFKFNDCDLKYFGSQGQQKLAVLAFKLAEVDIFETMSGSYPVLLLDDIFSEFDLKKQNKLLKLINSKNIQSILTTTNLKGINKKYLDDSYIYKVENGKIERK